MSWHRIDEWRGISANFITCAEYQLFLDEKRVQGEYRQPDHWDGNQFPKGYALEPILGVHGEDAERFCEWLSQRQGNKFRYLLPTPEEVSNYPEIARREIGCWCTAEGKQFVYSSDLTLWKKWQEFFFNALNDDWNRVFSNCDHERGLDSGLNPDLKVGYEHDLGRVLYRAYKLVFDLDSDHTLNLAHDYIFNLAHDYIFNLAHDHILDFNLTLARALDLILALAFDLALVRDRDRNRALARAHALARDLAFARDRSRSFTLNDLFALRSLCCIFILLWVSITQDVLPNTRDTWYKKFWPRRTETGINRDVEQKLDVTLDLYAFFCLIGERRKGNLPAWEGIRIVRERLE